MLFTIVGPLVDGDSDGIVYRQNVDLLHVQENPLNKIIDEEI